MTHPRRRQIFVDHHVQSALLLRVASYWFFCLLSVAIMLVCWSVVTGPPQTTYELYAGLLRRFGPAMAASLLMLPLVLVDFIRVSNRFVSPIYRLRRSLRRLADGESTPPLCFRESDFWSDLADDFNRLSRRLGQQAARDEHQHAAASEERQLVGSTGDG